ncbi:unnamed protein product [Diamesa serratosioi]
MIAAISSVLCSIIKNKQKALLIKQISLFDDEIVNKFNIKVNYDKMNKSIEKQFICFLIFLLCADVLNIFSTFNDGVARFNYHIVQLIAFLYIAYLQSFQIYIFMKAIEYRMSLILCILYRLSDLKSIRHRNRNRIPYNLLIVKMLLIRIYEIIESLNESFGLSMIGIIIEVFASFLVNIYWLHNVFLNVPYANVHDVILFLAPTVITLTSLAHCASTIECQFQQIISLLSKLNEHQMIVNEIFLCILRKNFVVGPYSMFKMNYSIVSIIATSIAGFMSLAPQFKINEIESGNQPD